MWHYGVSSVTFDHGAVVGYWNMDGSLHVELTPRDAAVASRARAAGTFAVGDSKDAVIAVQGTPERIDHVIDETWHYPRGGDVEFDDHGHVSVVHDFDGELHVRH